MYGELFQTVLKSFIAVLLLFALIWLAGKKRVSDLSLFQFAAAVAVACLAALFATGAGYLQGITAILIFALVVFLIAFIPARIKENQESAAKSPKYNPKDPSFSPIRQITREPRRGLALNIIIDGKFIQEHLSIAHKDINWILDELKTRNVDINDVLLAYFDCDDAFFLHSRSR